MNAPWRYRTKLIQGPPGTGVAGTGVAGTGVLCVNSGTASAITVTGDATINPSTGVLTLQPSGVTAGSYGDSGHIPQIVVGADGRVTSVANVAVSGLPTGTGIVVVNGGAGSAKTVSGDTTINPATGASVVLAITGSSGSVSIAASETLLDATSSAPVEGQVSHCTTTDGTTWVTCSTFTVPATTASDWSVSFLGFDPITGDFARGDLVFTVVNGSSVVMSPSTPAAINSRTGGAGSTWAAQVVLSSNTVNVQVKGAASTTVKWSAARQIQRGA